MNTTLTFSEISKTCYRKGFGTSNIKSCKIRLTFRYEERDQGKSEDPGEASIHLCPSVERFSPDVRSPGCRQLLNAWGHESSSSRTVMSDGRKKNRCRLREINVFLDVNRIGPKNPYREEIFALLRSSNPRITFPTIRTYVLPLVTKVMISSSSISNLSRRDSYPDRWSVVMTFLVVTLVKKKKKK